MDAMEAIDKANEALEDKETNEDKILEEQEQEQKEIVNAMKSLIKSKGWKMLVERIDQTIKEKTEKIMASRGQDYDKFYTAGDMVKDSVKAYEDLKEIPQILIEHNS